MPDYYWSTNEERWGVGPFDSREEARRAGAAEVERGERFWTGVRRDPTIEEFSGAVSADDALERVSEAAYEVGGEAAEDWPGHYDREAERELEAGLRKVVEAWLEKHAGAPSFWVVDEIEKHEGERDA